MLKDGEKGVIIQRDKKTYAIAPHIPCGVVTPDQLENIAAAARKYNAAALKITSAARIAIVGIKEEDVDNIWDDLNKGIGHAVGLCVRSIKVCPGISFCRLAKQDSLAVGMKMDEVYHGMNLPSKMKIGVSGCKIQCAENCIKDVSLYGTKDGWTVMAGGMGGLRPRLAEIVVEDLPTEEAENMVGKIVAYYRDNAKRERIGSMIERIGLDVLKAAVLP